MKRLLEYGAAINAKEPSQDQTALMWAAAEHHLTVAKALIDAHADLKAHSKQGFTAMHFAARAGDQEMVQLLLAAGVDVNILSEVNEASGKGGEESGARRPRGFRRVGVCRGGGVHEPQDARNPRLHSAAGRDGEGPGPACAMAARSRSRPQYRRCRLHTAALGVDGMGKLHGEPRVWI